MKESVVLVHGIWSNGIDLWRLRRQLTQAGYHCHAFNYHVWQAPPAVLARKLHDKVCKIEADVVHFVGHSYGGIILMHLFDQYPIKQSDEQLTGRIVLLGSPVNGSAVGKRLSHSKMTRWVLGHSTNRGIAGDMPEWKGGREIGIIAGTRPLGMGVLAGGPDNPHDGTVSVEETRLKNATDFIILRVSHSGMLISAEVARQVINFLNFGSFNQS
jgi:pimeloyl-ACP methyl ester carboxylesterase